MAVRGCCIALSLATVAALGCSKTPPFAPPKTERNDLPQTVTVKLVDGWTGAPVAGAQVSWTDGNAVTDESGQFAVPLAAPRLCVPLDIVASGFLERRTCHAPTLSLWPVASDAESAATRTTAFHSYRDKLPPMDQTYNTVNLGFEIGFRDRPEVEKTWLSAAAYLKEKTNGRWLSNVTSEVLKANGYWEGYRLAQATSPPSCAPPPWFTWSFKTAGFCIGFTDLYFLFDVTVDPDRLASFDVAVRALLYTSLLEPHPLPGIMNESNPSDSLSEFELKTLHMMGLRADKTVTWPDFDTP